MDRDTVFGCRAGRRVYELHAPTGATYVMQSWSQQIDPTRTEQELRALGSRLTLPTGWSYTTRTLTASLRIVTTNTPALVLQDKLGNSYSLETEGG